MLFHEIYGSYYDAVAAVLREATAGTLTPRRLTALVRQRAFSDSVLAIPRGLTGGDWRLLRRDMTTPIALPPEMPLTTLQRRWLKALLLDPRIRLFDPDASGLEDVEPLFTPDMFVLYDRYSDGDDYADPGYQARFRTILRALREGQDLHLRYRSIRGRLLEAAVTPHHLEYSEKDDRFRLIATNGKQGWTINLSGVEACVPVPREETPRRRPAKKARVTFELTDERNALERVLLHFSHLEKETERLEGDRYRVTLRYDPLDETELVVRILSFGPVLRVLEPPRFADLVKDRIMRQVGLSNRQ